MGSYNSFIGSNLFHDPCIQIRIRALPDAKKADIPIFAMTANAFEEDRQNALKAGMNGHIAKPLDVPRLLSILADALK